MKENADLNDLKRRFAEAIHKGDIITARLLLDRNSVDVNWAFAHGFTPLMIALARCQGELVRLLLDSGADIRAKTDSGASAIVQAVSLGCEGIVEMFLEAGHGVNEADGRGTTPLTCAAARGHIGIVRMLLARGADPNLRSSDGETPLSEAKNKWNEDLIELLIESGAKE